jgi:hypothetical protein
VLGEAEPPVHRESRVVVALDVEVDGAYPAFIQMT